MAMASSYNVLFLFILISFLTFSTTQAQRTVYPDNYCSTTSNSTFQLDLKTLLTSLLSKATGDTQFYNTTVTGKDSSDSVYGSFMCRGDIASQPCKQCVSDAIKQLSSDSECSLSKEAVIWYDDECMVRYSIRSFFSTVETGPYGFWSSKDNISNSESFMNLLFKTMNETADEAASGDDKIKFATRGLNISEIQSLYCLAQCTPDLSPSDCRSCLSEATGKLPMCCEGKQGARVLFPSCNIRYQVSCLGMKTCPPYYGSTVSPSPTPAPPSAPAHVPATTNNTSRRDDSKFSQNPIYLSHNCSTIQTSLAFQVYIKTLLSYFSSNATTGLKFQQSDVNGEVYGLFMCRGDVPSGLCGQCILNATHRILSDSKCHSSPEAIIWYSQCTLRYSNRNFFSKVETSPTFLELNITNTSSSIPIQNFFNVTLPNNLAQLADATGKSGGKYVTQSMKLNELQTLYALGQCTQDLSGDDCTSCLRDVVETSIPWSRLGSVGGRVMYPSCNMRFELFQFYMVDDDKTQPTGKQSDRGRTIILIVVPTMISVMLFSFGYYLLKRKARKSHMTILKENFGNEGAALEPLQFNLVVIEAATNNFSHDNYLGKGGFGKVYKGILLDGKQIAVKRLSESSKQGVDEFKNEVLLIAKLQHRNLVAFIGFCLEQQEKILIYEYVPNKSLDYFLFDSQGRNPLNWSERYNIIGGIARGIIYLHEHSRLKVIHRDLKPSNILLDENMIPKISDFGLARIVEINQDQGNTNRIVGTYGYMSPEYIMLGQFSEKSDVFSFGVIILEIVTGKKNLSSYEPHRVANGLLSYVWRQWKDQTPLSVLDLNIEENYSQIEVIKCIQIGLLCVQHNPDARPTMVEIGSYLSSYSIDLPTTQEPSFFLHSRVDPNAFPQESSSTQSGNNSINEMSISTFLPR